MDFTILHFAIHIVWRANVICTCRKSGIARKTTVAYPELRLIGYSPDKRGKVFPDFKDSMTQAPLKNWLKDAGITKHISYHCSRHSFACLQLDAGTSIAVVQRYLGHKNVATTEVYAKISDAQKRASVGCITLKK